MSPAASAVTRRQWLHGVAGAALLGVAGCAEPTTAAAPAGRTVAHRFGETAVPDAPQRVVSVGYNDHDALLAMGVVPVGVLDWYGDQPAAVWPWARDRLGGARPAIVATAEAIDFEAVAAAAPDLVVALYAGLAPQQYETLTRIAPTVAQPAAYVDFGVPWQDQTRLLGAATGRAGEAGDLVADLEARFARVRDEHPAFAGRSVVVGALAQPGQFGVYGPQDPKVRFFTDLGFTVPDEVAALVGEQNFATVSTEQLSLFDRDLLVWYAGGGYGPPLRAELDRTPLYQQLRVVREGRVQILDDVRGEALAWSTVLSLPFALDQVVPAVAELL